jgi:hypothetical protein
MKNKSIIFAIIFIFLSVFITPACSAILSGESEPEQEISVDIPTYRKSKDVRVQMNDLEKIKIDLFGYEQTLFPNSMRVRVTDDFASDVYADLENNLIDDGWRFESSFLYDVWRKGDQVLFLYFEDNLTSDVINSYRRSYGIENLEPGQTLIFSYVIDMSSPQPNPTLTQAAESWQMTQSADSFQRTQTAIAADQQRTQQALEYIQEQTQQALVYSQEQTQQAVNKTQEAVALTQQSYDLATQTALEEQRRAESNIATATAIAPILEQMGTEFDGEDSLPTGMTIAREDYTRWDLTSKPGWLNIVGRYIDFDNENNIPKNVFVYPLTYSNLSIITRVDGNMSRNGQTVSMALTPDTYKTNGYTVKLGISMDSDSGRIAQAWGCFEDECNWWFEATFEEQIGFSGPVFLRLDVQELKYTFYFSENGVDWIYLGEIEGYSAGDNLILYAGGGSSWYTDEEFDAYFDFIRFSSAVGQ